MGARGMGPRTKGLLLGSRIESDGTLIEKSELARIAGFIAERARAARR